MGGNIFKGPDKVPLTQRINRADVDPTLKWLENILNIPLIDYKLGTTGKKSTSGDLDIAINSDEHTKDELASILGAWVDKNHPDEKIKDYVRKSGVSVHFKTPINGDPSNGFVQTDLMFGDPEYMLWSSMGEPEGSPYRAQHKHILINSIATARGYRWSGFAGLSNRETNERTTDQREITDILLGPGNSPEDFKTFDSVLNAIKGREDYNELIAQAVDTLPKFGINVLDPEEQSLMTESKDGPRIQHAEDVIFWEGSAGAIRALDLLDSLSTEEGKGATTIKWDGSPAVVFGRDEDGSFVFTDKSGFGAKGYDGKAKTPEQLRDIFVKIRRLDKGKDVSPTYREFANNMAFAFPHFEKSVPLDHRGYFFGDLLYYNTPPIVDGKYEFKPNIVTYRVEPQSKIGKKIGDSVASVVIHREIDFEGNKNPIKNFDIFEGDELLVVPPVVVQKPVEIDTSDIEQLKNYIKSNASSIDKMLNTETLRARKLSNFAEILYSYLNSKVDTGLTGLGGDFLAWVTERPSRRLSDSKKRNIYQYVSENQDGFVALWQIVSETMAVKDSIILQLEEQEAPIKASIGDMAGGEGYVVASAKGDIKLVDRQGFTKANRAIQRESLTIYWGANGFSTTKTLKEWARNLPPTNKTNKDLFLRLSEGYPITSAIRDASEVKPSLAEAVNWALNERSEMDEGLVSWGVKRAVNTLKRYVAKQFPTIKNTLKLVEQDQKNIVYIPGGFKPPHKGHLEMVRQAAATFPTAAIKIVSGRAGKKKGEIGRGGVTLEMARDVWNDYFANDPNLAGRDIEVMAITDPLVALDKDGQPRRKKSGEVITTYSPLEAIIQDAYKSGENSMITIVHSKKDPGYGDLVRKILSDLDEEGRLSTFAADTSTTEGGVNLSATDFRNAVKENDFETFKLFLPEFYNDNEQRAGELFALLGGQLNELSGVGAVGGYSLPLGMKPRYPEVAGSEKKKKHHPKDFIAEDEIVSEVVDYLLGISVG